MLCVHLHGLPGGAFSWKLSSLPPSSPGAPRPSLSTSLSSPHLLCPAVDTAPQPHTACPRAVGSAGDVMAWNENSLKICQQTSLLAKLAAGPASGRADFLSHVSLVSAAVSLGFSISSLPWPRPWATLACPHPKLYFPFLLLSYTKQLRSHLPQSLPQVWVQ